MDALIEADALTPDALPPYAPNVTSINFAREIRADGQLHEGTIWYRDLNADLKTIEFEPVQGEGVIIDPVKIFLQVFPDLKGAVQGEVRFRISTTLPQDVHLRVVLTDLLGNTSDPAELRFAAIDPYHRPEIAFVTHGSRKIE